MKWINRREKLKKISAIVLVIALSISVLPIKNVYAANGNRDWRWPVPASSAISSCYMDGRAHYALDIPATQGANVYASYAGTVIATYNSCSHNYGKSGSCGCGGDLGNYVYIRHTYNGVNYVSRYGHLTSAYVSVGASVTRNTVIGTVGSTGYSTGHHLDFRIYKGSTTSHNAASDCVDPLKNQFLELPNGFHANAGTNCCYVYAEEVKEIYSRNTVNPIEGTPVIFADEILYERGETVTLNRNTVSNTNYYWLTVWHKDEQILSVSMPNTTYELRDLELGTYIVYLQVGNELGKKTSAGYVFEVSNKIEFDLQGGSIEGSFASYDVTGVNTERAAKALVVYNISGMKPNTNIYGREVAVDANGKVIQIREYGSTEQLTVPNGRIVVSGQHGWENNAATGGVEFTDQLRLGDYVGYDNNKVYAYHSYDSYLVNHKHVSEASQYNVLPVPEKEGYYFEGWFTEPVEGEKITRYSDYSTNQLYAHWSIRPVPTSSMTYNGHTYELFDYSMSWEEAKALCESRGGNLVTITSAEENAKVTELAAEGIKGYYAIGGESKDEQGKWSWVTGETFEYSNWDTQSVEGNTEGEPYAYLISINNPPNKQSSEWIDGPDKSDSWTWYYYYDNVGFICEYDYEKVSLQSVSLDKRLVELEIGEKATLNVRLYPENTSEDVSIGWITDDSNVAIVENGVVTAVGSGECDIIVTAHIAGASVAQGAICHVTVTERPEIINPFTDVHTTDYYHTPVLWAVEKGITDGWTPTQFAPNMACTRGQVVTFLWRAAGQPKVTTANPFTDVAENAYYYDAVLWAVENGITDGWTSTQFAPDMECTRGQIVTFLWRAAGHPGVATGTNPFADVAANAYYYEPILWAVKERITDGWTQTQFAPEMNCTRGQIVTFLYRYHN